MSKNRILPTQKLRVAAEEALKLWSIVEQHNPELMDIISSKTPDTDHAVKVITAICNKFLTAFPKHSQSYLHELASGVHEKKALAQRKYKEKLDADYSEETFNKLYPVETTGMHWRVNANYAGFDPTEGYERMLPHIRNELHIMRPDLGEEGDKEYSEIVKKHLREYHYNIKPRERAAAEAKAEVIRQPAEVARPPAEPQIPDTSDIDADVAYMRYGGQLNLKSTRGLFSAPPEEDTLPVPAKPAAPVRLIHPNRENYSCIECQDTGWKPITIDTNRPDSTIIVKLCPACDVQLPLPPHCEETMD